MDFEYRVKYKVKPPGSGVASFLPTMDRKEAELDLQKCKEDGYEAW